MKGLAVISFAILIFIAGWFIVNNGAPIIRILVDERIGNLEVERSGNFELNFQELEFKFHEDNRQKFENLIG